MSSAPNINIYDLYRDMNTKKKKRLETFDRVLTMCHNKIRDHATKEQFECVYEVPEFIVGMPVFDINRCLVYIIKNLRRNGFKVTYHFPKYLHISWKIDDINIKNKDSMLFIEYDEHPLELEHKMKNKPPEVNKIDSLLLDEESKNMPKSIVMSHAMSQPTKKPNRFLDTNNTSNSRINNDNMHVNNSQYLTQTHNYYGEHKKNQGSALGDKNGFTKLNSSYKPSGKFVLHMTSE